MEDYRKSDPEYTAFVPRTASEAIDLFTRYRKLGVPPSQWPETFCHVSRALPDPELDRFHEWLVCPQGSRAGPTYVPCPEIEKVRVQLAAEADARDVAPCARSPSVGNRRQSEKSLPEPKPVGKGLEKPLEVGPDSL